MLTPEEEAARGRRERWWRSAFIILATIYVGLLLLALVIQILGGFTQIVLIVFMAWLLAFVLSPVVAWLTERRGVSRGAAIGVTYAATLIGSGFLLFYAVSALAANTAKMAADFPLTRAHIERTLREWADLVAFGNFELNLVELYRDVEATMAGTVQSIIGDVPEVTFAVLGALVLVIILSLYMLADSAGIIAKFERVVPNRYHDEFEILERNVSRAFGGFLRAQVILAGIQTVLTVIVIIALGLPYGFVIATASALAMLIPFFGPPLALIPPIVATAIFTDWVWIVAPVLLVVQTVLVNYLQPRLMREALGMHPLLVLIGLLVGAQVAGLWGALFGIPVLAVANVFFNYIVNLRAIEETPAAEMEEVLEEVRQESPEATPEELAALAADRVEEEEEEAEAAAEAEADARLAGTSGDLDDASSELRAAAGDLRAAAGEQRTAAGEIGESAADLRSATEELLSERSDRDATDGEGR
ncbi:MAG TPA: AI-2E family transporter [Patescibacteria group bacterium]|nr:AI-2E family transporter [Patescibacteria group bacterium]